MSAQSVRKDKEASTYSKTVRSNSVDSRLTVKTQCALEILSVQQAAGKLTPDVDQHPSDSNDVSVEKSIDQSLSCMKTAFPPSKVGHKGQNRVQAP